MKRDNIFTEAEDNLLDFMLSHADYNFQFNFSGGKDSTCIVGLLLSLISQSRLPDIVRERVLIYHSDTTIESPLFTNFTQKVLVNFKNRGLKVIVGKAKIEQRMFAQIFGYGKPIPNHAVRWCTDNLKIKLAEKFAKRQGNKTIIFTGEHVGESKKRDDKLKKSSCGSSECGSDSFKTKKQKRHDQLVHRPIKNWKTCQVWDYLTYLDYVEVIDFYDELATVYKIANDTDTNKSLRMGCVGCPVISIKNHYDTEDKGIPNHLSLKLSLIFESMRDDNLRLRNPRRFKNGKYESGNDRNGGYGAFSIESRLFFWREVKKLNEEMRKIGFDMISQKEIEFIEDCLRNRQYPITYHKHPHIIQELETEWNSRKPIWL